MKARLEPWRQERRLRTGMTSPELGQKQRRWGAEAGVEQLPEPLLRLDKEDLLRVEQRLQVSKGMKRTSSWTGEQSRWTVRLSTGRRFRGV